MGVLYTVGGHFHPKTITVLGRSNLTGNALLERLGNAKENALRTRSAQCSLLGNFCLVLFLYLPFSY